MYQTLIDQRTLLSKRMLAVRECVPEEMWLTGIEPVQGMGGLVAALRISGRGFSDRLKTLEESQTGNATAVEIFRDRLKLAPIFTESVSIEREGDDPRFPGQVRTFVIVAALKETAQFKQTE